MLKAVIVSIAFLLCACADTPSETPLDLTQSIIDARADSLLQFPEIHAVSIGVLTNNQKYLSHYGELDPGQGIPPTDNTMYEIASITKTFTGMVLAHAVTEGRVQLDDDIRLYLKDDLPNLAFEGRPITIKHLATHTGGFPHDFPELEASPIKPDQVRDDLMAQLRQFTLSAPPGNDYLYSNAGTNVLAYVLEQVYQMPIDQLFQQIIYDKAGLRSTFLGLPDSQHVNLAGGYHADGSRAPFMPASAWAAAGLKSTLPDLVNFMAYHIKEADAVTRTSHERLIGHSNPAAYRAYYWLVNVAEDGSRRLSCHGGGMGSQAWIMFYPEKEIGVVVMTNESDPQTGGRIIQTAKDVVRDLAELDNETP